jgi:hypothetical protein
MSALGERKEILLDAAKNTVREWDQFWKYSFKDRKVDMALAIDALRREIQFIEESE